MTWLKVTKKASQKGVCKPVQFNEYGTPVVPIRKAHTSGSLKPKLRICGDYSVGINDQLEDHRHPLPLLEELMQKLGGGFGYTKIDLADAYNQIQLAPESQRRLAHNTHRGVLLQQRLPFGIKSAPGRHARRRSRRQRPLGQPETLAHSSERQRTQLSS